MEMPQTWIGLIAFIAGGMITPYLMKRMQFKFREKRDENANALKEIEEERIIDEEQMQKLKNHHLFMHIEEVIRAISSVYFRSKKNRAQQVFSLLYYYILCIYKTNLQEQIKRVDDNRKAARDHVTRLIRQSIIIADESIRPELIERGIPPDVADIFLQWYKDHYEWFQLQLNTVLNNKTSYYGQVDQTLWTSSSFLCAINTGFRQKIDTFNGNVESKLVDDVFLNINWGNSFLSPEKQA